jgi:hypothetical protein
MQMTALLLMVFLVAFENGFFWKRYHKKRREEFHAMAFKKDSPDTGRNEKGT